uniref:Optic atrophy 3 protein homolog n=1 Tax=Mesocestoides corti TaxID=53468 RepID=A0A5K3FHJ6_MESCO
MVGAFPIFKLAVLGAKQISRPIANRLKQKAVYNGFFRRYVCIPSGQLYHLWDTRLKLKLLGVSKPMGVKKLTDESAAEMGAEILGELIMFSIGTFLLVLEYRRQSKNETEKERKARAEIRALEDAIKNLESRISSQSETLYQFSKRLENLK